MKRIFSLVLALAMVLSLAACGGGTTAATMHLRRTQGTVAVSDSDGKDVPVLDNLGLYSGYGVNTRSASYAWIDLDDVKLTKLDQNSGIAIRKEGKALNIELKSGSLFFNVSEPLADDETMNISTSTMLVGIRGTCGWVEERSGLSRVYIIEGKVECSAEGQTVRVSAGQMAELTKDGELTVQEFDEEDLPVFVRDDLPPDMAGGFGGPDGSEPPGATEAPAGEVTWSYDNGVLTISGTGRMEDYDITPWYENRNNIIEVVIEYGVTSIGSAAFCDCHFLTGVTIPNSVTRIGDEAFRGCNFNLTSVTIPDSVTSIGNGAFYDCDSLIDVYYGGSADQWNRIEIGNDNDSLLNADIHYNSTGADTVYMPSVAGLDVQAALQLLQDEMGLAVDVRYEPSHTVTEGCVIRFTPIDGMLVNKGDTVIIWVSTGPETSNEPEGEAAASGDDAGANVTWDLYSDGTLVIRGTGSMDYDGPPPWFEYKKSITKVVIENGVTSIGYSAFTDCDGLTSVTIPDGVTAISNLAFSGCSGLTSVTIPDGVTIIGQSAFSDCGSLASVTIPDSVTAFGLGAFSDCDSLADVYYGGSESQWKQIEDYGMNDPLMNANIHYNSTGTGTPTPTPDPAFPDGYGTESGPMYLLTRELCYAPGGSLVYEYLWQYDAQGYLLSEETRFYSEYYSSSGGLTYEYLDERTGGLARFRAVPYGSFTEFFEPYEDMCLPGRIMGHSSHSGSTDYSIYQDPLFDYSKRTAVSANGGVLVNDNADYDAWSYAVYTFDAAGNPASIVTYNDADAVTGTATLEWQFLDVS